MIYTLSSVKVAQHTTLLLYESIYIVSFLFHEYETDIDFKVFYMNYFEILEKLFLLQDILELQTGYQLLIEEL